MRCYSRLRPLLVRYELPSVPLESIHANYIPGVVTICMGLFISEVAFALQRYVYFRYGLQDPAYLWGWLRR